MNKVMNTANAITDSYKKTDSIIDDVQNIIEVSQKEAYRSVNMILSQRNWLIGYRIAEEELAGGERAEYGTEVIKKLSKELTKKYGKGYTKTNLYNFYKFYKYFPEIFHSASGKFAFKLYLPTEEELRKEIETQKAIFYLQQKDENGGEDDEATF